MPERQQHFVIDLNGNAVAPGGLPVDGLSLGRGVFETILVVNGKPVFADEHLERLSASCAALDIARKADVASLFSASMNLVEALPHRRARMRIALFSDAPGAEPVALVAIREAAPPPALVSLRVASARPHAGDRLNMHKTVNYLPNLLARAEARKAGFDDALFLDGEGNVAETTTANIFFRLRHRLVTPPLGAVLPGIVRAWVKKTALGLGVPIEESHLQLDNLAEVEGAFVTNSIVGLAGVARIDSRELGDPASAEWFQGLRGAYGNVVAEA